jgi:lactoylglutathione lyase
MSAATSWRLAAVHHLGLTVADLERSIRFYRDILGLPLLERRVADADYVAQQTGYVGVRLDVATFRIAAGSEMLLQMAQYLNHAGAASDQASNRPGNTHLCLVVDDVKAAYEDLRGKGVPFKSAPIEISAGPHRGGFGVYLFDPDGYTIELHQRRPNRPPQPPQ